MRAQGLSLTLDLNQLSPEETTHLTALLYPIHQQIFSGADQATFRRQVLESRAEISRLSLRINRLGQPVGYCAIHFFHLEHGARTACVVRAQAGLLREYRRGNSLSPFFLSRLLCYRLRHPWRQVYFFATLIHPSSYLMCDKYARTLWPRPMQAMAPAGRRFLQSCLARFGYDTDQHVVPVGWQTRDREEDHRDWCNSPRPAVRFFLQHNPGYRQGQGLVTLAPVSVANLSTALKRLVVDRWRRWRARDVQTPAQDTICTASR